MTCRRVAAVALLVALAGGGPDLAACEEAMAEQVQTAMDDPNAAPGTRPEECEGATDAQLEEIAGRLVGEQLGG